MRLLVFVVVLLTFAAPAFATNPCQSDLEKQAYGPWMVVREMADYKAAMDSGYAACMVNYPKEFAEVRTLHDFIAENTKTEMEQALQALDYIVDHPQDKKVAAACGDDKEARNEVKDSIHAVIKAQYNKAYMRRHKVMADASLVSEDQDSCMIVLKMVHQYDKYYGRVQKLHNILYESSRKQKGVSGVGRQAYKRFEAARDVVVMGGADN